MKQKFTLVVLALCYSTMTLAEETKIEITSFLMAGLKTNAAEVCGTVTGATTPYVVAHVTVDEKNAKPGNYYTLVGKEGRFCLSVVTYQGTAIATVDILGKEFRSDSASLDRRN